MRKLSKLLFAAALAATAFFSLPPKVSADTYACVTCEHDPNNCIACCHCGGSTLYYCANFACP